MTRSRGSSATLLVGAMFALSGCFTDYDMREFSPPDGSFTVSVPATPRHESRTVDTPEGKVTLHSYSVEFDDVIFGVNATVLPPQVVNEPDPRIRQAMMEAGRDGMLAANGWRLIEETGDHISLSASRSISGKRIIAATPGDTHTVTARILLHGGRGYQVIAIVPKKPSYNQEVYSVKFLESFRPGD
jgi:hypothetical protein